MGDDFPRVLFITPHAFNKATGGGITFSNLFDGWPSDRIATAHTDPEPTTGDVCTNYFVLGAEEFDLAAPFAMARRAIGRAAVAGGPSGPTATFPATDASGPPPALPGEKRAVLRSALIRSAARVLGDGLPERVVLSDRLCKWIEAFEPDVLYTILGSNGMMRLVREVRDRYKVPVVVHFMDDWMSSYHRGGLLGPAMRREMVALVQDAVQGARTCLGISPAMCEAFSHRFGRPFEVFQNTIDVSRWARMAKGRRVSGSPADIVYAGSIFPNAQLESLVDCCRAVAALDDSGIAATLTISSPSGQAGRYRDRLAIHPSIQITDTIRDDEAFFHRIAAADLLLLPVNFSRQSIRFIRYSMPTKVPAYLAVGTPIFAYGPRETAQMRYAEREGWAFTLSERNADALVEKLKNALCDEGARARVSAAAMTAASRHHDAATVRARFRDMLRVAAGKECGVSA
ncbi:MAG: hypothetical protein AB1781_08390 [Pseudomonadota bacterium]